MYVIILIGKIGRQAAGSVVARTGDTMVYSTVCIEREAQPVDFTPLRVDYFARYRYDIHLSILYNTTLLIQRNLYTHAYAYIL